MAYDEDWSLVGWWEDKMSLCIDGQCVHCEPLPRRVNRVLCHVGRVKHNRNAVDECDLYKAPKSAPKAKAKKGRKKAKK